MADAAALRVTVCYSPAPRETLEWDLMLPAGCSVAQAVEASELFARFPGLDLQEGGVGIWGRKARPEDPVRDGDRVEVYRALRVDPKLARRERFRKQGVRAAGLFARPGKGKS